VTQSTLPERLRQAIPMVAGIGNMWAVFQEPQLFNDVVEALADPFSQSGVTKVAGIEARGFVLGAAVAHRLGAGFVGIRKPGGLYPGPAYERRTPPDYRGNEFVLRLQKAAIGSDDRVALVDDWFETGGQAGAAIELIGETGADYAGASIVVDWLQPEMRHRLAPLHSIVGIESLPSN